MSACPKQQRTALIGLVETCATEYMADIKRYLSHEQSSIISAAISALRKWNKKEIEPFIYLYLSNSSSKVRKQCIKLLKESPSLIDYPKIRNLIASTHNPKILSQYIHLVQSLSRWDSLLGFLLLFAENRADIDALVEINLDVWLQQHNKFYTIQPSEIQAKWFYILASIFSEKALHSTFLRKFYLECKEKFNHLESIETYPCLFGSQEEYLQYLNLYLLNHNTL